MIYRLSKSRLGRTSVPTYYTATLWTRCFPASFFGGLLPSSNICDKCSLSRHSFPDMLPMQVSRLVGKIKEESAGNTMSQLQDKITSLSRSELARATDALSMIWDGIAGLSNPPVPTQTCTVSHSFISLQNWQRVKSALYKSIRTGTFLDAQFYAYNAFGNDLLQDLKPLFTSSIVIERWGSAITTRTSERSFQFTSL